MQSLPTILALLLVFTCSPVSRASADAEPASPFPVGELEKYFCATETLESVTKVFVEDGFETKYWLGPAPDPGLLVQELRASQDSTIIRISELRFGNGQSDTGSTGFGAAVSVEVSTLGGSDENAKSLAALLKQMFPVFHPATISMGDGYHENWTIRPICGVRGLRAGFTAHSQRTYIVWSGVKLP